MAIVKYTETELNNLARLMRAEAVGDGDLGMLMVGNVVVNRTIASCYTFNKTNTIIKDTVINSACFISISAS